MLAFTVVDLFAATVNAFNGGLLGRRPDHYKRRYFSPSSSGSRSGVAAIWFAWEEPMPRVPARLLVGQPERETLKAKMQPGWEVPED